MWTLKRKKKEQTKTDSNTENKLVVGGEEMNGLGEGDEGVPTSSGEINKSRR